MKRFFLLTVLVACGGSTAPSPTPAARVTAIPKGGFCLWLELPSVDEASFVLEVAKVGVQITAGRAWFPAEASGIFLRLSFAAADERTLEEGIARLGRVWRAGFGR